MGRYQDALEEIFGYVNYEKQARYPYNAVTFDLSRMEQVLERLGQPQERFRSVHIAGTKGKGSTSAMVESVLRAAGYRTGLYTSPHLHTFRERIRLNGGLMTKAELVSLLERCKPTIEATPGITAFEVMTALAFQYFAEQGVEWAVLEVGLGGRLDATNVVHPAVAGITSLSYDHVELLGHTLSLIAFEKAGIIKPGVPVVTLKQMPEVMEVISQTAIERQAPLTIVTTPLRGYRIGLFGQHQLWNATLAVAALKAAGFRFDEPVLRRGLANVDWPGRFQRFEDSRIILDGAHNPDAAETLARCWQQAFPREKASVVFGGATGKDIRGVLRALQPITAHWHFTSFDSPRSVDPALLQDELNNLYGGAIKGTVHPTVESALSRARENPERVLVTGSLYLVGEVLALLRGEREWFQRSTQ